MVSFQAPKIDLCFHIDAWVEEALISRFGCKATRFPDLAVKRLTSRAAVKHRI